MTASFTIAARNNGFNKADARLVTHAAVTAYRQAMAGFADMGLMDTWYARLDEDQLLGGIRSSGIGSNKSERRALKTAEANIAKARTRDSLQALSKLCERVDGQYRIVSQPPVVVPARDLAATYGITEDLGELIHGELRSYRETLREDIRELLERFEYVDSARKVVQSTALAPRLHRSALGAGWRGSAVSADQEPQLGRRGRPQERVCQSWRARRPGRRIQLLAISSSVGRWAWISKRRYNANCGYRGSAESGVIPVGMRVYADMCGWTLAQAT
jgi:hypothetical protein